MQAVVFLFRFGHDGSSMVVTMADAERVLDTASKTRLCRRDPELLLEIFMENCGAGEKSSEKQRRGGSGGGGVQIWRQGVDRKLTMGTRELSLACAFVVGSTLSLSVL